jgi:hypothetical protein
MGCLGHLSPLPHASQKLALVFTEAPHEEQNLISEFPRANGADNGRGGAVPFCLRFNRTTNMSTIATTTAMSKDHSNKEFDCVVEINCSDAAVETAAALDVDDECLGLMQNSER